MNAITFPVLVDGKNLTATCFDEVKETISSVYLVRFSDGYEDEFVLDGSEGSFDVQGSKTDSEPYALAINNDMPVITWIWIQPDHFFYVFQHVIDGNGMNVWILESDRKDAIEKYKVYYDQFYRFTLSRTEGEKAWKITRQSAVEETINTELATKVGFILDTFL